MYKYKHGVQVTALGIVVAPISRSQKKKKKKLTLPPFYRFSSSTTPPAKM